MTETSRRADGGRRRRARRALLVAVIAVGLAMSGAGTASAHTGLVRSSPAAGSVGPPPSDVRLTFSASLQSGVPGKMTVTGPGGPVAMPDATVSGPEVAAPLPDGLPSGGYTVAYRVIAEDGHPITGQYGFSVVVATSSPSAPGAPPNAVASAAPAPAATSSSGGSLTLWVVLGGLAVVVVAGFAWLLRQTRVRSR